VKVIFEDVSEAAVFSREMQKIISGISFYVLQDTSNLKNICFEIPISKILDDTTVKKTERDGVARIKKERLRQIIEEGVSAKYDLERNTHEECARAAALYALPENIRSMLLNLGMGHVLWPWATKRFKPTPEDRIRDLEKAGALVAAEIDRLLALEGDNHGV
jgi:hypothetical protein